MLTVCHYRSLACCRSIAVDLSAARPVASASSKKIKVANPIVDMDGDEMTR